MSHRPLEPGFIALHTFLSVGDRVITITPALTVYGVEDVSSSDRKDLLSEEVQEREISVRETEQAENNNEAQEGFAASDCCPCGQRWCPCCAEQGPLQRDEAEDV